MAPLVRVENLRKSYPISRDVLGRVSVLSTAVDGVSFDVARGETLALVGESGAGKSTVGRLALGLIRPDSGTVMLDGRNFFAMTRRERRHERSRIQMIFQDPYSSLDPKINIRGAVAEPLLLHEDMARHEREAHVEDLLERVGIRRDQMDRFPYELSGGQLQRVAIARAIATGSAFIVCDEPVAALDVSIRAQVINLLRDLQRERGIAYLFISHDLSLVGAIADRVAVMYAGRIVECGPAEEIFTRPRHPYTQQLLGAIPEPDPTRRKLLRISSREQIEVRDTSWHHRCAFYETCAYRVAECASVMPELRQLEAREIRCHLVASGAPLGSLR